MYDRADSTKALLWRQRFLKPIVLNGIPQDAEAIDLHLEDIARLHIDRWLARSSDTARSPCDDHVSGFQAHSSAD